jgi:hypothetical protein
MSFWSSAFTWIKGSSISSTLVKTAALGYAVKLLSDNVNRSSGQSEAEDPGVRIQLNPDPQVKIPVLYGSAFFGGAITDVRLSTDQKTITYCLTLAEQTGTKLSNNATTSYVFDDVYLNNNRVVFKADGVTVDYTLDADGNQDISARDLIKIYMYAAGPKQPDGYTSTTPAAHTVMPGWTAETHPMTGLVYAIVSVTYNRAKNVTGLPECKFHLTSNMTLPGDVLNDYMKNTRYGAGIDPSEIDNSLAALNTYASTGFSYKTPTGQITASQININGLIDTSNTVIDIMEEITKCSNSWISYNIHKGQWTVVINQQSSATAVLNDDNIIGEISVSGTSLTQLNNIADVKFRNATILDKEDFVKIQIPEEDLFQNEPRTTLDLSLPLINKQATALRIGLQALKQRRVDKIINFATDFSYLNITAGDVVSVSSPPFGFTNKLFRVITAAEEEGDSGDLIVRFTCLEYDADVYEYDIQEFAIETADGILNIGSIGKPGTPQVTKFEQDVRPRIKFESVSPSGIVEGLEFWITSNTTVAENQRSYRLLATRYPDTSATETWVEGTNVVYEDDALPSGNFFVKTRGINALVVGPYSDPSGLIAFVPEQTTDAIGPNTKALDALGGLLTALAIVDLLKLVDELYQGVSGNGSLFERIFETLEDVTGIDFTSGDAIETQLPILDEGTQKTGQVSSINFIGAGVTVTNVGNAVTVNIPGGGGGGGGPTPPEDLDPFYYFPKPPSPVTNAGGGVPTAALRFVGGLPADKSAWAEQNQLIAPPLVPNTGPYYARWAFKQSSTGSNTGMRTPLIKGTGSAKLYKSDGTLVQSVAATATTVTNDIVSIPFNDREPGTDYYVLFDADFVRYCSVKSLEIDNPQTWNFTTSPFPLPNLTPPNATALTLPNLVTVVDIIPFEDPCDPGGDLLVEYSQKVQKGAGTIKIRELDPVTDELIQELSYNASAAEIRDKVSDTVKINGQPKVITEDCILAWVGLGSLFQPGSKYEIVVPIGLAVANTQPTAICDVSVATRNANSGIKTVTIPNTPKFDLLHYHLYSDPYIGFNNVNIRSRVKLEFNKNFKLATTNKYIDIYEDGALWQRFNVRSQYKVSGESEIIMYASDPITDPFVGQVDFNSTGVNYTENVIWNFEGGTKNSPFTKSDTEIQPTAGGYSSLPSGDPDVTGSTISTDASTKVTKIPSKTNPGSGTWEFDSTTSKWVWVVKETVTTESISAHDCSNGTQILSKVVEEKFWKGEYDCASNAWSWAIYKPTEVQDPDPNNTTPPWNSSKQVEPNINVILLNPTKVMKPDSAYYILIESGAIIATDCEVDESFAGITDVTRVAWKTDQVLVKKTGQLPPSERPLSPKIPINSFEFTFEIDRPVNPAEGKIIIVDGDGNTITELAANDPRLSYT